MLMSKTNRIKSSFSKWYLDFAEKNSKLNLSVVKKLNRIRKRQRNDSRKLKEKTQIPEEITFNFTNLLLFRIYPVEEISDLELGIKKLFPMTYDYGNINDIFEKKSTLTGASSAIIGNLCNSSDKGKRISHERTTYINSLPTSVKYVQVGLHRMIPSFYILTFNAILSDSVSKELMVITQKEYLSDLVFKFLSPQKVTTNYHEIPVNIIMPQKIADWQGKIFREIKDCITNLIVQKPKLIRRKNLQNLKGIELYTISNDKHFDDDVKEWNDHHHYMNYWNIPINTLLTFKNDKFLLIFPEYHTKHINNYKIIANADAIDKENEKMGFTFERDFIINSLLQDVSFIFAPYDMLKSFQRILENSRYNLLIKMGNTNKPNFSVLIKLISSIQKILFNIEQFNYEFKRYIDWFKEITEDVEDAKMFHRSEKKTYLLPNFIIAEINGMKDFLKDNISLIQSSFNDYLNYSNLNVATKLQKRMYLLTVIITLATLLGLWINWQKISATLKLLYSFLLNLIGN